MGRLKLRPLLRQLTIIDKDLHVVPLDLDTGEFGWAQSMYVDEVERQYNRGLPVRTIVLKARQLGISTVTEGIMFNWAFLHKGTNGLVIAHENDASANLFQKTKIYWETWPWRNLYSLKYSTKREMHWLETRSSFRVATAKNVGAGRGSTLHTVHASECAFYPDPRTLMIGLNQTIPNKHGTFINLESTANGVGNWFHEQWQDAVEGISDYVPCFYPWWRHHEYRLRTRLSSSLELSPDERKLLHLISRTGLEEFGAPPLSLEDAYRCIQWRRWAIPNKAGGDEKLFMQEYPADPEEAFISTGLPIFPLDRLAVCFQPKPYARGMLIDDERDPKGVRFVHDSSGPLLIYGAPKRGDFRQDRYFAAGDPSMTIDGDPASIQVINRGSMEQVASWHGRIDPVSFAYEMMRVGKFYNNCTLCPEVEGGGQSTVATMLTSNYPHIWMHRWADKAPGKVSQNYGWSTNFQRKAWAVGNVRKLVADTSLVIHDRLTYDQMRNFVVRNNGEWGNADPDVHDDSVMALAICITASMTEGPFTPDHAGPRTILDIVNEDEYDSTGFEEFGQ